jgi:PAS domain S-box-containing protein
VEAGSDRFEHQHRRKDGSLFDVNISVQRVNLDDGFFVCFLQDITARKKAERALKQVLRYFQWNKERLR